MSQNVFHPRAQKLIEKRKPFIVVSHDEPYFGQVYALIREHEIKKGTWTNVDEIAYLALVLEQAQPPAPQGVASDDGAAVMRVCPFCGATVFIRAHADNSIVPHCTPVIGARCSASDMPFSEAENAAKNLPTMDDSQ